AAPAPAPAAAGAGAGAAVPVPVGPCVLCGQPAAEEVDGFPQHLTAEECAAALSAHHTPLVPEGQEPPLVPTDDALPPVPENKTLLPPPAAPAPPAAPPAVPARQGQPTPAAPAPVQPPAAPAAPADPARQEQSAPAAPAPVPPSVGPAAPAALPAAPAVPPAGPARQEQSAPTPAVPAPVPPPAAPAAPAAPPADPARQEQPAAPVPARPRRPVPAYASGSLVEQITGRVQDVVAGHGGDIDAAEAALIKAAIPDVMALMKSSRVGGRYEHSEFPPTAEILHKKSQKGADEIWEGRPKWRNAEIFKAAKKGAQFDVTALDMNAAYLSALKCWLPIGQLREDTSGVHDKRKAGVHLITPADWDHADLPNPLGNRLEPGELWVTESTLRQLLDCARQGLADAPVIHRSLVSGATEALLEKMRRALAEVRKEALAQGDDITVAYVKAMYSKFVSTIGESSANRDIRRPDWMHIIRSKAFANLWMKAHKAHRAGLQVVEISGTDELHLVGDWRKVFSEGRDLSQVKVKNEYVLGGKR
ncbi:hypothetical protein ACFVU3_39795, partial [Streptomyces sp. NPDC058052]|uniref:hypothetical protein n=1 Tax=Streptomyces sp. NPDC058052 TaxID=3346316 RepID=UPI0036E8485B